MTEIDKDILAKNAALKEKVREFIPEAGLLNTPIAGFNMSLRIKPTCRENCFYKPMVIIVLQGQKRTTIGSEEFIFSENQCVVTSIDIPTAGRIIQASPEKPFITLFLELDSYLIIQLLAEMMEKKESFAIKHGMGIADVDVDLLDAFLRLVKCLEKPEKERTVLAPMIVKEIHYLLLCGSLGAQIRQVNTKGTKSHQIARAIALLKDNFKESLKMEDLAEKVNMAPSSFYRNFNKVTSLSPLQYQKRLRLYEAQRLMLLGSDAAGAAYEVGYESPTQFNKEYKCMFGDPPRVNIKKLQAL